MLSFRSLRLFLVTIMMTSSVARAATLHPTYLRCEYKLDPLGIDVTQPRMSWILESDQPDARDLKQSAYQVLVASSRETLAKDQADLWDSGKVASDETAQIVYRGKPLGSRA